MLVVARDSAAVVRSDRREGAWVADLSRRALLGMAAAAPLGLLAACSADAAGAPSPSRSTPSVTGDPSALNASAVAQGPLAAAPYGPTGGHWPTRTPARSDRFDLVVESDCTWQDIANAISYVTERTPRGRGAVLVKPGVLQGYGAGSSDGPVLQNVGALGRPYRVLVSPRDGAGTVTTSAPIRVDSVRGVAFVGFWLYPQSVVLTSVQDVAWAWSKGQAFNITTGRSAGSSQVELVECVTPAARASDNDTWAIRTGGTDWSDIRMTGCYISPSYKAAGSSAHCDTLQLSGSQAGTGLVITDTVIFASTNSAFIPSSRTTGIMFDHSLVVAGDRMLERYPLPAGANGFTSGAPSAVNGSGTVNAISGSGSTFIGSIHGQWLSVQACSTSVPRPPAATSGAFATDPSLASVGPSWLDAQAPMPTDAALKAAWAS
jgi:hypothetical protein